MTTKSGLANFSVNLIFCLLIMISGPGCKKENNQQEPGEILSFKIEASLNNSIMSVDITGTIKNREILLKMPEGIDLSHLVATLVYKGKQVSVSGVNQQSGKTANNFTQPITYQVVGEDNLTVSYTVRVESYSETGLSISDIIILRDKNSFLGKDEPFVFNKTGDSAFVFLSPLTEKTLIPTYTTTASSVLINGKQAPTDGKVDFTQPVKVTLISGSGFKRSYVLKVNWAKEVPHIYINTNGGVPVVSKDDYVNATIRVDSRGLYDNYEGTTRIKGRGNSTWGYPKKPYRLKLDNNAALFGLAPEKDWVLLANYLDGTLMLNSVAMKAGSFFEVPYTNNIVPVEVTLNNQYLGSYAFTEQVETGPNRINVGNGGLLLELDDYYDEPYKFRSAKYDLPVMIKYPEITTQAEVAPIKALFDDMESMVEAASFPLNSYADQINIDSLVRYFAVYQLTDNEELNHPKSVYMHKSAVGKFIMGPIWDFDWAYGYESGVYFGSTFNRTYFWTSKASQGTRFFSRLFTDPKVKTKYKEVWTNFRSTKFPQFIKYIDDYSSLIEASQARDYALWKRGSGNFRKDVADLKTWLNNRASYIDNYVSGF